MTPTVYFAGSEGGPVKIGFTIGLDKRLSQIRTGSAAPIELLASVVGDRRTETYFHSVVAHHRLSGEWFKPEPEVMRLVETVNADGEECIPPLFRASTLSFKVRSKDERLGDMLVSLKGWIEVISQPRPMNETIEQSLLRVARAANVSERAVKAIWYGECSTTKAEVYLGLKETFEQRMAAELSRAN